MAVHFSRKRFYTPVVTHAGSRRGPYAKGIERRRQIIDIALEVFGARGFRGATLREVALRAGGTPAAILKLFGSKEQLLIAVLRHWDAATATVMGDELRGLEVLDGFRRLMRYHEQHPGLLQLYITIAAESATEDHPAQEFMRQRYARTLETMRVLLSDAVAAGDLQPLDPEVIAVEASTLLSVMDGLELQYVVDRRSALEGTFSVYVDSLLARLGTGQSSASVLDRSRGSSASPRASASAEPCVSGPDSTSARTDVAPASKAGTDSGRTASRSPAPPPETIRSITPSTSSIVTGS